MSLRFQQRPAIVTALGSLAVGVQGGSGFGGLLVGSGSIAVDGGERRGAAQD